LVALAGSAAIGLLVQMPVGTALAQEATLPQRYFALPVTPELEPRAIELLQAMSDRLTAAETLSFTAVATYESPARTGMTLAYMTRSAVTLQRPDRLRVITPGDGPSSEFYYDGTTMMAYTPDAGLVAVSDAPPSIDDMLQALYGKSATYFPFTDVIVADPYADLADGLQLAFVVGQSIVVGDTLTDIVVIANPTLQAQLWIGAEDRLPRRIQASFFDEFGHFRHVVEFSDWQIDPELPLGTFVSAAAANAPRIPFAPPGEP
jgi:hypothetical protein